MIPCNGMQFSFSHGNLILFEQSTFHTPKYTKYFGDWGKPKHQKWGLGYA